LCKLLPGYALLQGYKKIPSTTVQTIPLYLPPDRDINREDAFDKDVFFGAISLYMREKIKIFKNMPDIL
jgi:hypothetical protein